MTESRLDRLLVKRAHGGDREAFDALFRAFEGRVTAFIRSRIRPGYRGRLDEEEVLQDTFVRAFRSIGRFKGEETEQFRRWLTGIARNCVLRAEEEARRRQKLEIQNTLAGKDDSPGAKLRREERFSRLQRALDSLSGDHREVIRLTRFEGLSLKEAAECMGRSPEAVRKLFWRALQQLRNALTDTRSLGLPDRPLRWDEDRGAGT